MQLTDLDFNYPDSLIAIEPSRPSRVAWAPLGQKVAEISIDQLLLQFEAGDLLVINESQVTPSRVFAEGEIEVLFLKAQSSTRFEVLFPARDHEVGDVLNLPGGLTARLIEKGLPQILELSQPLSSSYFFEHGEMALPPYIQAARGERHQRKADQEWYQTAWAKTPGSVAAPTASLHFTLEHLEALRARGVMVEALTLHVGAGTFLPIKGDNIDAHKMHSERVSIPASLIERIEAVKENGRRVWALGTTATRALESMASGLLEKTPLGHSGETSLFIKPGYQFKIVDGLLTNFHQPRSTLLCLVAAFAGMDRVREVYSFAIDHRFKLFSYGDLSAWTRN